MNISTRSGRVANAAHVRAARRRRIAAGRRGLAVTELAVCLPILTLLVFGSIQACNLIYLKHALTSAAYEGTLELSKSNASNASVEARVQQVLDARDVTDATINIFPNGTDVSASPSGTSIRIRVRAQVAPNLSLSGFFPSPQRLTVNLTGNR